MDQAWALEQTFWELTGQGRSGEFYRRHMTADGFVVLPNRVVSRNELVSRWEELEPAREWELSEPALTLIEGGNVVITYAVRMDAVWLPDYRALMTALYVAGAAEWMLQFRTHTPAGDFPF